MRKRSVSLSVNSKKIKECFQNFNNPPPRFPFVVLLMKKKREIKRHINI